MDKSRKGGRKGFTRPRPQLFIFEDIGKLGKIVVSERGVSNLKQ